MKSGYQLTTFNGRKLRESRAALHGQRAEARLSKLYIAVEWEQVNVNDCYLKDKSSMPWGSPIVSS
jgi:hypothetical protein